MGMVFMRESFWFFRELNLGSMMLRILLAMLVGGVIGFERERRGRAAGFRTYIMVSMGAAVTVILGQYLDVMLGSFLRDAYEIVGRRTDVARLGTYVISGVGFLAAGTIIVTGKQEVMGLTTAAGLWASACLGLAVGAGFIECVAVSFVLITLSIWVFPAVEAAVVSSSRDMHVYLETENIEQFSNIIGFIKHENIILRDVEINRDRQEHLDSVTGRLSIRLPARLYHAELIATLSTQEGVITIDEV